MANFSPKIEIINHFDNLIHRIDIDIEQCIEKYKDQRLGEMKCFPIENRHVRKGYKIEYFDSTESSENNKCEIDNEWSESTKVIDYLNDVRQKTISELRKAQEESLKYLKSQSKAIEELKSRLFVDKFYFQLICKHTDDKYQESWVFNLYTIVTDFYLSFLDINLLE